MNKSDILLGEFYQIAGRSGIWRVEVLSSNEISDDVFVLQFSKEKQSFVGKLQKLLSNEKMIRLQDVPQSWRYASHFMDEFSNV